MEEGAPVDFGFTEGDAHAEESAFAVGGDAHGDQDGTIEQLAILADFFIPGIDHKIGIVGEDFVTRDPCRKRIEDVLYTNA